MAKQLSLSDFLAVLTKSQLLEPERVQAFCGQQQEVLSAATLAERMVAAGLLTRFQSSHLLRGRWHRYFIGPYKVMDRIGTGTNSQVYLCEHTRMKRRAAVKVLQADKARSAEAVKRFEREAMAAAAIRHPNIVHAYDLGRDDRLHYLVMEYVDGRSLLQLLGDEGRMAPRQVALLLWQAASGLHVAHQAGVVHRDVKPSNLMVSRDGRLKILDLGLARYTGDDENLTRGGAVLGLAAYIAPEQATDSHNVDARADIYGLGATFWLAVTGKKPPVYGQFAPPPPRTPAEAAEYDHLIGVIRKMMALRREDRYQSAAEVVEAIGGLIQPGGSPPVVITPAPVAVTPAPRGDDGQDSSDGYSLFDLPAASDDRPPPGRTAVAAAPQRIAFGASAGTPMPPSFRSAVAPLPPPASAPAAPTAALTPASAEPAGIPDGPFAQAAPAGANAVRPQTTAALRTWSPWAFLAFGVLVFLAALAYLIWG
jgi:serine/threonine protein kinase